MKVGLSSGTWPAGDTLTLLRLARECGYDAAELCVEHLDRAAGRLHDARREAEDRDLVLSLHGPFRPGVNVAAADEDVRRRSVEEHLDCVAVARELGARVLVMHAGTLPEPGAPSEGGSAE